jgi:hypothetical protein
MLEWKLGGGDAPYNLSRSFITYNITYPAGAADQYICEFQEGGPFQQIYFGPPSGLGVVDLVYSNKYQKAQQPLASRIDEDFLSGRDQLTGFYPSRCPAQENVNAFSLDGSTQGNAYAGILNNTDIQHLKIGQVGQTLTVTKMIPLSDFVDTFFAVDRSILTGTEMVLRMYTASLQQLAFYTKTPNAPASSSIAGVPNWANITTVANASNITLWVARDVNLDVQNSLRQALIEGEIVIPIPYTYAYRFSQSNGSSNSNLSLTLTKGFGRAVSKIQYVCYNNNEFGPYALDNNNSQSCKVQSYQSFINSQPLSDSIINTYNGLVAQNAAIWPNPPVDTNMAYRENYNLLRGSVLGQSAQLYDSNFSHTDSWSLLPFTQTSRAFQYWTNNEGLSLTGNSECQYQLQANTPGCNTAIYPLTSSQGNLSYIFVTFLRHLHITPAGIVLTA